MRERVLVLLRLILFWIIFLIVARALFMGYNFSKTDELSTGDILLVFLNGLKMDLSITGYVCMLCSLILTISVLFNGKWVAYSITGFNFLFLLISSVIIIIDIELYRHWGFRLNTTPLFYMGSEAAGSADPAVVIKLLIILSLFFGLSWFAFLKFIKPRLVLKPASQKKSSLVLLLITALFFLPIRGSVSVAPMSVSFVYFHKTNMFANHAGINVIWNFLYSLKRDANISYPENYFDKPLTHQYFDSLMMHSDSTIQVLKTNRPNIILIITESYTANVIESLGGMPGIAPNLTALSNEGILFDNFYSSGDRTDKGLVSILSAYPAPPLRSIIMYENKVQKLPQLSIKLNELGYTTSFVYGGDADFANFRSFISHGKFEHLTTVDDFPSEINTSKWGVHDEYIFDQALKEIDTTNSKPFFKTILTLSSHEPFDVPMEPLIKEDTDEARFLNACHYTDKCIGDFIQQSKKQPWWDNTLIIITADHGHRLPGNIELKESKRFKIPLLWLGGAVKSDTVIHTWGGHTDIANTLLAQLNKPSNDLTFSKNLLDPAVKNFAMYIFNNGYGYIAPERYIIYDATGKMYLKREGASNEEDLNFAKAYMQTLYSDYNSKK